LEQQRLRPLLAVRSTAQPLGLRPQALIALAAGVGLTLLAACAGPPPAFAEAVPGERLGDEIVACGRLFHIGTEVVLWSDDHGYDAYRQDAFFPDELRGRPPLEGPRYGARSRSCEGLDELRACVDQFVLHYDVCGTSRQCFKILHDHRKLSVHFLLDVDGTIYQTLDLRERAWHATKANDRSVGIEMAHIGAYPRKDHRMLVDWYGHDAGGPFVRLPAWMRPTGLPPGFVGRPARPEAVRGTIGGQELWQYDFTPQQYAALARLMAGLATVLPRIRLEAPRAADGSVAGATLSDAEFTAFTGVLGHYHVQANKSDPGPAFDWDRALGAARALRGGLEPPEVAPPLPP